MVDTALFFSHVEQFKVLVCMKCEYCIQPGGAEAHLRRSHKDVSLAVRKELVEFCASLLLDQPEAVASPHSCVAMINGLKLVDGFKCMECEHLSGTERSIRQHCKTQHGRFKSTGE